MNDLEKLILFIQKNYDRINDNWKKSNKYFSLNMKRTKVQDFNKNESLLNYIFDYRNFINENVIEMMRDIQYSKFHNIVNSRVKALNSIQYKIDNYNKNHENGKIPIKKCLNDIFGLRMIFEEDIDYDKIKTLLSNKFPNLKCIESIRGSYQAIHIYFGNDNNKNFQWELQLWDKKHEKSNLESHAKYKQDYTKWEMENI